MSQNLTQPSIIDWQLLGEIENRVGSRADRTVRAWLHDLLQPLQLNPDLLSRILKSTSESMTQSAQDERETKDLSFHILVFVSSEPSSKDETWGYFRIEKVGTNPGESYLEYYLYRDAVV